MTTEIFLPDSQDTAEATPASFLPEPQAATINVPKNIEEVSAQIALALHGKLDADTLGTTRSSVESGGTSPLLAQVLEQEAADNVNAAKAQALAFAQVQDAARAEQAARAAQQAAIPANPDADPVGASKATATRALESMTDVDYARRLYRDMGTLDNRLQEAAGDVAMRNAIASAAEGMGEPSTWEVVKHFFRGLIPGLDAYTTAQAINKATGSNFLLDKYAAIEHFRNYMLGLDASTRPLVVKALVGELSTNKSVSVDILRQIAELSKEEAVRDASFDLTQVGDLTALFKGLATLARKGTPLKAVKDVAGEKAAGEAAATDLTTKAGLTGLNNEELVARVLAAGVSPLEADPAALKGLSPAAQAKLKSDWDTLLTNIRERLNSSSMSEEEIQKAAAQIRDSWMQATNKRIYHVEFGEASADGQKMTVYWQDKAGNAFTSKEAAEAFAQERGLLNYQVVPKNIDGPSESAVRLRANAGLDLKGELAALRTEGLATVKEALAQINKHITFLEANRNEETMVDLALAQQWKKRAEQLMDNGKAAKSMDDVIDWWQHHDEFVQDFMGTDAAKAKAAPSNAKPKLYELAASQNDMGEALRGQKIDDIKELFNHAKLYGRSRAVDSILDQWAEGLSKGKSALSLQRVLTTIAKRSEDASYRHLAERLLSKKGLKWETIPVRFKHSLNNPMAIGGYDTLKDDVGLNIHAFFTSGKVSEETLIHEAIHAHNTQVITLAIRDPKNARRVLSPEQFAAANEVRDLQLRLREHFGKHGDAFRLFPPEMRQGIFNMLEFPDELLTYGLTHPSLRIVLSEIKLADLGFGHNQQSVWSRMWQLFKDILGFKGDDSALAKLYDSFDQLVGNIGESERSILNQFVKVNPANEARVEQMLSVRSAKRSVTGEWLVREERNDPLSYDSLGKFGQKDIESMPFIAVDPKHGASEQGVEARVVGVHAEARTKQQLVKFIEPYYKGLSRDQVRKVEAVLKEGDAFSNAGGVGREFTFSEVTAKGLNEREALAYLATRSLRMAMYHIRNGEMVRHLRAMGMKEIEFVGRGIKTAGRVLDEAAAFAKGPVYDLSERKMVSLAADEMNAAYGSGKRVVQLAHPVKIDGELRQTLLVDNSVAKSRDIHTALHYRPGEFSRIYTDEYFITLKKSAKVDGVAQDVTETIRTARSAREAREFVDKVGAAVKVLRNTKGGAADRQVQDLIGDYFSLEEFKKAYADGEFEGLKELSYHYTRNQEEYLNGSVNEALASGRLFTSKRSERLFSTDRTRENTLGVFESLQAEITNISRVANLNQWRETMVRRWMNTFGDLIPNRTGNDIADFYSAAGAKFTKGTPDAVFAERTHKYIMRQIGLRTSEERYYEQMTRRMTEKFFSGNERIESVGMAVRKMGLLGFLRNINFNLTLGMFNPAQLLVQANGAATAMMLSPLHGLGSAKTFPLLRMALMSDREDVWRWFAKWDVGGNADDFVKLVKAVRQTGVIDNLRSTSLYNLEDGKFNIFGAYPSKVMGSHAFFFNRGEEFSRLVSFDVARREFQKAHPELDWATKDNLAKIVVRMDDLTQNMTRANLARFQEGAASLPLQFAQYNIKLAANVMSALLGKGEGRGFTKREALQLMAGHILLYGAAGNGLVALMDEMLSQETKDSMPVAMKTYLSQGLVSGLLAQVGEWFTGERTNVALGSRLGTFNYYQDLANAVFTDPKNVYAALMGPTVSTARRLGVIGDVAYLWYKDPELSPKDVMEGLLTMTTEQVSSLRNVTKAYIYAQHANKMVDKNGFGIAQLTPMEVLGQALGFQPTAAVDVSNLIKTKKDHDEAINDLAATIFQVQKQIMLARAEGNHQYADEQHKLLRSLWPENTGDFMEVQRRIRDKLYPYDHQMQKLLGEYLYRGQTYDKPLVVTQQPRKE